MDGFLTVKEVAALIQCHPQTVYRNKSIPRVEIPGVGIRFSPKDIQKLAENNRSNPVSNDANLYNNQQFSLHLPIPGDILKLGGKREMAKAKSESRSNLGYGAVYPRETKSGIIRWYAEHKNAEGKRVQKLIPLAITKEDAILALQVEVAKVHLSSCGIQSPKSRVSFNEYAESFKTNYLEVERKNCQSDVYRLNHLADYFLGKMLDEIDSEMIRQLKKERLENGNSERTVNRYMALLKRLFNLAIEQGYAKENPVKQVKFYSERDTHRSRVLSNAEEIRLLAESPDYLRCIVLIALHTGLRYGEIKRLKWNHVDFDRKEITVEKTKGKCVRFIPMNRILLQKLGVLKKLAGRGEYVFSFRSIRTAFENACKRAKISGFVFHDLRRTFGTRLLEQGTDIVTIQRLYGHSSLMVTQLYLHPDDKLGREAVIRLAAEPNERAEIERIPLHPCDTENPLNISIPPSGSNLIN